MYFLTLSDDRLRNTIIDFYDFKKIENKYIRAEKAIQIGPYFLRWKFIAENQCVFLSALKIWKNAIEISQYTSRISFSNCEARAVHGIFWAWGERLLCPSLWNCECDRLRYLHFMVKLCLDISLSADQQLSIFICTEIERTVGVEGLNICSHLWLWMWNWLVVTDCCSVEKRK